MNRENKNKNMFNKKEDTLNECIALIKNINEQLSIIKKDIEVLKEKAELMNLTILNNSVVKEKPKQEKDDYSWVDEFLARSGFASKVRGTDIECKCFYVYKDKEGNYIKKEFTL